MFGRSSPAPASKDTHLNSKTFFDVVRSKLGPFKQDAVDGITLILSEALRRGTELDRLAYILATVWHETAHTMQPIAEYGKGKGRKYGTKGKHGQVAYGRGYVQLTWDYNYEKADKKLGLNGALTRNYDLALDPKVALPILFVGMEEGWFTGRAVDDYLDGVDEDDKEDLREFSNARRVINGTDKQVAIGQIALTFEKALRQAAYSGHMATVGTPDPRPVQPAPAPPAPVPTPVPDAPKVSVWVRLLRLLLSLVRAR